MKVTIAVALVGALACSVSAGVTAEQTAKKASLYGRIVDHWQITIADVGPSGLDQGMAQLEEV